MNYELYRHSTLGATLTDSLDELIQSQQLTPQLAMKVLQQFDKSISEALSQKIRNRTQFKGHLDTYRFCDDVWTFILRDASFRTDGDTVHADKVKIVACNTRRAEGFANDAS